MSERKVKAEANEGADEMVSGSSDRIHLIQKFRATSVAACKAV